MFETNRFDTYQALDQALAEAVAARLQTAVNEKGRASLVVSGGSTPLGMFALLSQQALAWEQVTITLADERCVPADHPDSNEKLVREKLLVNNAGAARFVSLLLPDVEKQLQEIGKFDLVILGMGADGHTASLFPKAGNISAGLDLTTDKQCLLIDPVTAPHQRVSLTLKKLLHSEAVIIHITGNEKLAVLGRAKILPEPQAALPISAVIKQQQVPVILYWA